MHAHVSGGWGIAHGCRPEEARVMGSLVSGRYGPPDSVTGTRVLGSSAGAARALTAKLTQSLCANLDGPSSSLLSC